MSQRTLALFLMTMAATLVTAQTSLPPKLTALSAIVMEAETGTVVYQKNSRLKLPPASTTKIMTALLLLERCRPEELITAPDDIKKVRESSMHLMPGEAVSAGEMVYALMLRSANDGCHAVACHIAGSDAKFAALMNKRARELGCQSTSFTNPHGLPDPNHLTTTLDLALMARYGLQDPKFAAVVKTQKHTLVRSLNQKDVLIENRNRWLALDPSAIGVKTGYTKAAGQCFVGAASRDGVTFITAILKCEDWVADQQALTDWAFASFEKQTRYRKGEVVARINVSGGEKENVAIGSARDVTAVVPVGQTFPTRHDFVGAIEAPVKAGTVLTTTEVITGIGDPIQVDLVALETVEKRPFLANLASPAGLAGFGILFGGAVWMRARARRYGVGA